MDEVRTIGNDQLRSEVRTASSEQVRSPIYRDGVDRWRQYRPWLGPLERALGPAIDAYPAAPAFVNDD